MEGHYAWWNDCSNVLECDWKLLGVPLPENLGLDFSIIELII